MPQLTYKKIDTQNNDSVELVASLATKIAAPGACFTGFVNMASSNAQDVAAEAAEASGHESVDGVGTAARTDDV